jgi:hypothetical protein
MDVQFLQIFTDSLDAKIDYINQKLAHSPQCLPHAERWASATDDFNETPHIAESVNWAESDKDHQAKRRIKCATRMVDRFLPLAEAEVIEEDSFSYLTDEWGHAPQGTPVLRRITNQAVVYCFFDEFHPAADAADTARESEEATSAADAPPPPAPVGFGVEEFALEISQGLLDQLGAAAIERAMGSAEPDYFGVVYAELCAIVARELDAHLICEVSDELIGAQSWNNSYYLPFKGFTPAPDPRDLADELNLSQDTVEEYLAKLMDARVAKLSLGEFLIGASMQLAFIQELWNVTGADRWRVALSDAAQRYADHAENAWRAVGEARSAKIDVQLDGYCVPVDGATKCSYYYTTYDYFAEAAGSNFFYRVADKEGEQNAQMCAAAEAQDRRQAAIDELRFKLGKPEQTIAAWRALS